MNVPEIRFKGFSGEWNFTSFSSLASLRRGLTYSPESIVKNGTRVLRSSNINDDMFVCSESDVFVNDACVNIPLANYGDILITAANGSPKLVGKHAIIDSLKEQKVVPGGFMLLATTEEPFFLNASMGTSWYRNFLKTGVSGGNGAIGNLSKNDLEKCELYVPVEKNERNALASYFTNLDSLISSTSSRLASLKQIKTASLQSMFPQNGETTPKLRFKGFVGEWKKVKLGQILVERHEASTITEELPQLSFTIAEGVIRPEKRKSNKRDFLIKDIVNKRYLITKLGDIIYNPANVVYGAIHMNALCNGVVSPIYKIFYTEQDSSFIECSVRRPDFISKLAMQTEGTVTKLKTLKPESFLYMCVMIAPTIDEQQKIANYFTSLDRQITLQTQRLEKLKQIKSACLDKMFV